MVCVFLCLTVCLTDLRPNQQSRSSSLKKEGSPGNRIRLLRKKTMRTTRMRTTRMRKTLLKDRLVEGVQQKSKGASFSLHWIIRRGHLDSGMFYNRHLKFAFDPHPHPLFRCVTVIKRTNMTLKRTPMTWSKWRGKQARSSRMMTARPLRGLWTPGRAKKEVMHFHLCPTVLKTTSFLIKIFATSQRS